MTKSLFECILNSDEYIDYLDDIAKLCAIIVIYYVLHSGDQDTPLDGEGIQGVFQSVFPIKDFNETSPGMMLIELSAYVGDVLNFYIDKQYRELILTMAQEKKNVVHVAKMLGYKTSPVKPANKFTMYSGPPIPFIN